ncbi:MAG: hypothetical protein LBP22_13585 [Deltaproteobacteria bacterium]|nr:hypothetical protein [Deltaproteobacteria bacterium]
MSLYNSDPPTLAEILLRHLKTADLRDINPFVRGYGNELISRLAPYYPDLDRLNSVGLRFSDNGWFSADTLYQTAHLSEKFGPGQCFLQVQGYQAFLPALNPDQDEELWNSLPQVGPRRLNLQQKGGISLCPLWGPCLGQRVTYSELLGELAEELNKELDSYFRAELIGCPKDCRLAMERTDVGLILAQDGQGLTVFLGGRHRFGHDPVVPEPIKFFELSEAWPMLDFVFMIHDQWYELRLPEDETLPETVSRLGLDVILKTKNPRANNIGHIKPLNR